MLKRKIVLGILMLVIGSSAMFAQNGKKENKNDKMKELRKAYLIENLELTESESNEFFPVYQAHSDETRANKKAIKEIRKSIKESEKTSESDFLSATDKISDLQIDEIKNKKQFLNDILPILGVDRTKKLGELEREFRREMKEKRKGQKQGVKHK